MYKQNFQFRKLPARPLEDSEERLRNLPGNVGHGIFNANVALTMKKVGSHQRSIRFHGRMSAV